MSSALTPNALAFIGLCNEYCVAVENARESSRTDFVSAMLRLLPRLYISATDLAATATALEECYIDSSLDEEYYEAMRRNIEHIMGPDDSYLEVFEDDMKYSDTPIAASISENLADLFQVCYEFVETIRDAPDYLIESAIQAVADDFGSYWSRILCNVLRALNHVRYNSTEQDF